MEKLDKYLVKYKWTNPMRKDSPIIGERMTTRNPDGSFNIFEGAIILGYVKVDNIWPDERRIDLIGQNGNEGLHYDKECC